jgi:hypothetical protein
MIEHVCTGMQVGVERINTPKGRQLVLRFIDKDQSQAWAFPLDERVVAELRQALSPVEALPADALTRLKGHSQP